MAYRTSNQKDCKHEAKLKMVGFKDRFECVRCQKILPLVSSMNKEEDRSEDIIEYLDESYEEE